MVKTFFLRAGSGPDRVISRQMTSFDWLIGRRLSRPHPSMPQVTNDVPADSKTGASAVAIYIDDESQARQLGATCRCYHLVLNFSPSHLSRALTAVAHGTDKVLAM